MKVKPIAFYLPQYHPIPENDEWWGKGFTEWTNVTKAKPLFRGHEQPKYPADLGYYDLRLEEVRAEQAKMAREYGIYGFCYYHYWFGNGKQLLERPFNEVLQSGEPDFPFMLCWANQTWKGVWFGASTGKQLIEQIYPGQEDFIAHFQYLLKAFLDRRYIKINQRPVFLVYMPLDIPDLPLFVSVFRNCAKEAGLPGIYLLATNCPPSWNPSEHGFDGVISQNFRDVRYQNLKRIFSNRNSIIGRIEGRLRYWLGERPIGKRNKPYVLSYEKASRTICNWPQVQFDYFPMIVPNWDNSPRSGNDSMVLKDSEPQKWKAQVKAALSYNKGMEHQENLIFIKSWNEWAEGNYLEPDEKWGYEYLEAMKAEINEIH